MFCLWTIVVLWLQLWFFGLALGWRWGGFGVNKAVDLDR